MSKSSSCVCYRALAALCPILCSCLFLDELQADSSVAPVQAPQQIYRTPDYTGDFWSRSALLGDFGGTRQEWANNGVTIDASLTQVAQGVVSGGLDTGWEYLGRGQATLNLDTTKMGLWPGGLLTVMGEGNFGDTLTRYTGSLLGVNQNELLPEADNSFVLPQVTFTQFLSESFGVSLGKFATINANGGDLNAFAHGKGDRKFLNLAFNVNPVTALTVPYSTLGITLVYLPTEALVTTFGVIDPHGKADTAGFDELFEDGATFVAEGRYATSFFGKTGHQLLGATYSSSTYVDLDQRVVNLIIPGLPVQDADGSWAVYWNADQYFYQPDTSLDRGVGVFARFGLSDGDANPIENFASVGIGGKGMFANRAHDTFGVGYFYSWIADNRITRNLGFEDAQGFEAFYSVALTPAIFLSPDIQWIEPSQKQIDSSWVLGLRLLTDF